MVWFGVGTMAEAGKPVRNRTFKMSGVIGNVDV